MKKALKKYLLPLCMLVAGGYGCMYAGTFQSPACYSPVRIRDKSGHAGFNSSAEEHGAGITLPASEQKIKEYFRACSEENEDESVESAVYGKYPLEAHCGLPLKMTAAARIASYDFHEYPLPYHFFAGRLPRYITLRVLRI